MVSNKKNNIVVTGMPRSGTTLLTAMIDSSDNSVALVEPMDQFHIIKEQPSMNSYDYISWLVKDFSIKRQALLNHEPLFDKRVASSGQIATNIFRETPLSMNVDNHEGLSSASSEVIRKGLNPEFNLAVKHTGPFLSILEELLSSNHFKVVLIYRDPIGVISSWRSIPTHPLHYGRMPGATRYWSEMRSFLDEYKGSDLLEKQIRIMEIACRKIRQLNNSYSEQLNIINYQRLDIELFKDVFKFETKFKLIQKRNIKKYEDWELVADKIEMLGVDLTI